MPWPYIRIFSWSGAMHIYKSTGWVRIAPISAWPSEQVAKCDRDETEPTYQRLITTKNPTDGGGGNGRLEPVKTPMRLSPCQPFISAWVCFPKVSSWTRGKSALASVKGSDRRHFGTVSGFESTTNQVSSLFIAAVMFGSANIPRQDGRRTKNEERPRLRQKQQARSV
jgi:hypothetical protein